MAKAAPPPQTQSARPAGDAGNFSKYFQKSKANTPNIDKYITKLHILTLQWCLLLIFQLNNTNRGGMKSSSQRLPAKMPPKVLTPDPTCQSAHRPAPLVNTYEEDVRMCESELVIRLLLEYRYR